VPSAHVAPDPLPSLGRFLNPLVWRLVDSKLRQAIDPVYNEFVESVNGRPRRSYSLSTMYSPDLHFQTISPLLFPPQPHYPRHHKFTGPWYDTAPPREIPGKVEQFLAMGEPPVVISLGSMGGTRGSWLMEYIDSAVRSTGRRAIIQSGWSGLRGHEVGQALLFTDWIPHAYLFPRAAVVVHHGGSGTTHAVCRAGVPSVVVPFMGDQIQWAKILHRKGVAPRPLL